MKIFHLPDLGEGLPDAEIVTWHIAEGDSIKQDEPLVSMETAKAVVDVPSPYTGKINKLHGKAGDIILTGAPLVEFEMTEKKDTGTVAGTIEVGDKVIKEAPLSVSGRASGIKILPAVRALAKKLNVDLALVHASGSNQMITADDIKKAAESFKTAGPIEPLKGVRRIMALAMAQSHREVVPVTIFDDVNVTAWANRGDYTVRVIQAVVAACAQEPALNAWFDGKQLGRRLLKDVNLGLAMDTADGLFVPVIQNAQSKDAQMLRTEINTLKETVTSRTIKPEAMQGATIVVSNFGKFAGRYASPVVVPPTVAILGVGALRQEVVAVGNKAEVHPVLPLSLTFDHRAVTGGEATRFLKILIENLSA